MNTDVAGGGKWREVRRFLGEAFNRRLMRGEVLPDIQDLTGEANEIPVKVGEIEPAVACDEVVFKECEWPLPLALRLRPAHARVSRTNTLGLSTSTIFVA